MIYVVIGVAIILAIIIIVVLAKKKKPKEERIVYVLPKKYIFYTEKPCIVVRNIAEISEEEGKKFLVKNIIYKKDIETIK